MVTDTDFTLSFNGERNHLAVVGLFCFSGQMALMVSLIFGKQRWKDVYRDPYTQIVLPTLIPLFICTLATFFGRPMSKMYHRLIDI